MDSKEGRDVMVVDTPNTFIQAKMDDDEAVMKLRRWSAETMDIPTLSMCAPFVTVEKE